MSRLFWYDVEGDEEFKLPGRTKNERLQSWKEGVPYVDVPLGHTKEDDSPWYDVNGDGQVMDNEVSIFDTPTLFHNLSDRTHSKTTAHFITFLVCNGKPAYLVRWREVWDKGEGRREIVDHGLPTQREIRFYFSGARDFSLGVDANGKDILIRIPPSK